MDLLCDNVVVEEILLRLPLASLLRLRAVSRRYNALALSPGFTARHRKLHSPYLSGGVFLRHARRRPLPDPPPGGGGGGRTTTDRESDACFLLTTSSTTSAEPAFATDIAGLFTADAAAAGSDVYVVHSSGGLLLCSRSPVHYYVCDPVARRCAALPELPRPPAPGNQQSGGLLSVVPAADEGDVKQFQVTLFYWDMTGNNNLDLEVFSSSSGEWTPLRIPDAADYLGPLQCFAPPFLGQSGTAAYWLGHYWPAHALAYSSSSTRLITVPHCAHGVSGDLNGRYIGERFGGGLRYAHFDGASFEVWDAPPVPAGGVEPPQWKLKHRAAANEVARRSLRVLGAFFTSGSMLHWMAFNREAYWRSVFALVGFDPADEDVFLFQATHVGRLAAYSMRQRKLSFRCKLPPGVRFAPFDMIPYVPQPQGAVEVPGMLSLPA